MDSSQTPVSTQTLTVGRPGLEPGTLGSRVHPDRCGGVLKRLDSSQDLPSGQVLHVSTKARLVPSGRVPDQPSEQAAQSSGWTVLDAAATPWECNVG